MLVTKLEKKGQVTGGTSKTLMCFQCDNCPVPTYSRDGGGRQLGSRGLEFHSLHQKFVLESLNQTSCLSKDIRQLMAQEQQ